MSMMTCKQKQAVALPSMNFLTSCYFGQRGLGRKSRLNSTFFQRRRVIDARSQPEPCSPRVTCVGKVKVKSDNTTSSSKSRRATAMQSRSKLKSKSMAPFLKKFESIFDTVCCVSGSSGDRDRDGDGDGDDRIQKQGKATKCESESLPAKGCASPSPKNVLARCRGASSERMRLWNMSDSVRKAETEDNDTDNSASGVEWTRGDSAGESTGESESLKLGEKGGSEKEGGEAGAVERRSLEVEEEVGLRRCNSEPGGIWRRFVSDPDMELGRRKFGF